jgi:hypothetical protein
MKTAAISPPLIAKLLLVVCMMLAAGGCQWMSTSSRSGGDPSDADGDARQLDPAQLAKENERLRAELQSQALDLAKVNAQYERQKELNAFLEEELDNLKSDLEQVERQFISFERRLQLKETKASAVAAIAEAQLLFDKLESEAPEDLDSVTVANFTAKLEMSDELMRKHNYAASVYYANRAMRILNQTERRKNIDLPAGTERVIAVSIANLREGPGSGYEIVGKLHFGTVIVQYDARDEWCRIRTDSGDTGWVHSSLLR